MQYARLTPDPGRKGDNPGLFPCKRGYPSNKRKTLCTG